MINFIWMHIRIQEKRLFLIKRSGSRVLYYSPLDFFWTKIEELFTIFDLLSADFKKEFREYISVIASRDTYLYR